MAAPTIQQLYHEHIVRPAREAEAARQTIPMDWDAAPHLRDTLLRWVEAVAAIIKAIGPPGDFGYESRPGRALGNALNTAREIQWAIREGRALKFAPRDAARAISQRLSLVQTDLSLVEWPKDVRHCINRFESAMGQLDRARLECVDASISPAGGA